MDNASEEIRELKSQHSAKVEDMSKQVVEKEAGVCFVDNNLMIRGYFTYAIP